MPEGFDYDKMIHKANQIALFFASYPHDEAVAAVADHLQRFWVPNMRRQLIAFVEQGGPDVSHLHKLVPEAVKLLKVPS